MKIVLLALISFSLLFNLHFYRRNIYDPLENALNHRRVLRSRMHHVKNKDVTEENSYSHIYISPQDGQKERDKISELPGQPKGMKFDQYSGYVTVDPKHGKALFYYFTESPSNSATNPLLLWLNGGPGCSSFGNGAMMELGPFRVNPDNKTLSHNKFAWNNIANVIFLESPAGVGFSYSNTTSDYEIGDAQTAKDSYTFLINWLERFPQYKTRDFYIAGQSYAGHYIPQLTQQILQNNKNSKTVIKLKGIALGNAYLDEGTSQKGTFDFLWERAIISDEIHKGLISNCNWSDGAPTTAKCEHYDAEANRVLGSIYPYDIYAPICIKKQEGTLSISGFDPCSNFYVYEYLNTPAVQRALHAKPKEWFRCGGTKWQDRPYGVLPLVKELMASKIRIWIYSGDTDAMCPVTGTKYDIERLKTSVKKPWNPWFYKGEVGGYAVGYENLTFVTIRGAGHSVPSYQPARALAFFSSFLKGEHPTHITFLPMVD